MRTARDIGVDSSSVAVSSKIPVGNIVTALPILGTLMYNLADNALYYGNGTAWVLFGAEVVYPDCDCTADATCPLLPQPPSGKPVPLTGENCVSCFEQGPLIEPCQNANAYKVTRNYPELVADLNSPYAFPPISIPAEMVLTPNPPLPTPLGQVAAHPVPLPGAPPPLAGKHVLVVGASKGIGLACAQRFVAEGANVVGTSRHPDCYPAGSFNFPMKTLDVRKTINVKRFMDDLFMTNWTNGQIDILVLSSGVYMVGQLADCTGDELTDVFNLLVAGYQRCVYYALPHMSHSNDTRIISMGSSAGEVGSGAIAAYSMCKRSLQFWNDTHQSQIMLRKARGQVLFGPTFSLVEPGFILSSIGLWEFYFPASVTPDTLSVRHEHYGVSVIQSLTAPNPTSVVSEDVYRIAVAPQPGTRYISDNDTPLPLPGNPTITNLVTFTNVTPSWDTINTLSNPFNSPDHVAAKAALQAAYV